MAFYSRIEARIARRLIDTLLGAFDGVSIDDGYEETPVMTSKAKIVAEMNATSMERVYVWRKESSGFVRGSWVLLVYGNGVDLISDYGVSLESVLKPLNDWIYNTLDK